MPSDCYDETLFDVKTYQIPFRPEYLLIEGPGQGDGPWNGMGLVSSAAPTGKDVRAYRFHLSPEAVALLIEQDPAIDYTMGFHKLTIKFDACTPGPAMIEVERAIYKRKPE